MNKTNSIVAIFLILFSCSASAYRQPVHMYITDVATSQSVLASNNIWNAWGFPDNKILMPHQKTATDFHKDFDKIDAPKMSFDQLLNYGVDAEDTDEGATQLAAIGGNATGWSRAFNHFFNPQADKKLDLFGIWQNDKSPVWSLETAMSTGEAHTIGHQNFSYTDAQEYYYMAFAAPTAAERNLNMGKMFQTLGHVVHHIQDMAQPEHTRLDKHIDKPIILTIEGLVGSDDSSIYEEYTNDMLNCGALVTTPIDPNNPTVDCPIANKTSWNGVFKTKKVNIAGYPIPTFNTPYEFWHTADARGLADFSSRNFITNDTPFGLKLLVTGGVFERLKSNSSDLPLPSGADSGVYELPPVLVSDLLPAGSLGKLDPYKNKKMRFLGIHAVDNFAPALSPDIPRMATFSVFSDRLARHGNSDVGKFATNYFNFDSWAANLLPRAVAYSTGLINYFFRMRLDLDEQRVFNKVSTWNIRSNYDFTGNIHFFYDDTDGVRRFIRAENNISLRAGQWTNVAGLHINLDFPPSTHYYAIAVDAGNRAVAATPFTVSAANNANNKNDPGPGTVTNAPISCNSGVSASGGNEISVTQINLGDWSGTVHVYYEMYNVPDTISISKTNSQTIAASVGPVSGTGEYNFYYKPTEFPDHAISVRIVGNMSYPTQWKYNVTCPQ